MRCGPLIPSVTRSLLLFVLSTALCIPAAPATEAPVQRLSTAAPVERPSTAALVEPATLWNLMAEASFVVLADVVAVTDCALWKGLDPPRLCRDETGHQVAELQIREIWKLDEAWILSRANLVEVSVEVREYEGVASMESPRYEPGSPVVAFLRHAGPVCTSWEWRTVEVRPGVLHPSPAAVEAYRDVLVEALLLQAGWPFKRPAPDDWRALAASRLAAADQGDARSD